jgi:hypothetical protein
MDKVYSKDGTSVAFEKSGIGPALIFVVGAFNDRTSAMPLVKQLKERFTVYNYDRRGRGDSGDTMPYAVEREIEDLEALIAEAGGSANVFGYSSEAALSLMAAAAGAAIKKLALYDLPMMVEEAAQHETVTSSYLSNGRELLLPDIDWVTIPAGYFNYQWQKASLNYDFKIARFLVTYSQFQTFVDSG